LALCLTACNKPEFLPENESEYIPEIADEMTATISAINETTLPAVTTSAIDEPTPSAVTAAVVDELTPTAITVAPAMTIRDEYFGIGELQPHPFDNRVFKSWDSFTAFIQNNDTVRANGMTNSDILSNVVVPRNRLSNTELENIIYREGSWISYEYKIKNYVYNDRLSRDDNVHLSRATYHITFSTHDGGREYLRWYEQCDRWIPLLEHNGSTVYYIAIYSEINSELITNHCYFFVADGKIVYAYLHPLPGLSALDMVKYLEMVPVM
jgi:hypothetical protein